MNDPAGRQHGRLRLTVSGAADLVVQLPAGASAGDDERATDEGPAAGASRAPVEDLPIARLLPATAVDAGTDRLRAEVVVEGWRFEVVAEDAHRAALRERAARAAAAHHGTAAVTLRAQIPGRVTRLWVSEGEQVEPGQRLLAVEAMKMENEIRAPRGGTVVRLAVGEGERVELNAELLTLA
jgi:biotin carboxyl carrier protein